MLMAGGSAQALGRGLGAGLLLCLGLGQAFAQTDPQASGGAAATVPPATQTPSVEPVVPQLNSSVVLIDRQRLFEGSLMGIASRDRFEQASRSLISENRQLESALEEEERQLTLRRATLPPSDFRRHAEDFDRKVEELRLAQESKSRALTRSRDADQERFFLHAVPVLGALMEEVGAVAILDRSTVVLSFDRVDITELAIARLNLELGDGSALAAETAPQAPPAPPTPPASGARP